MSPSTLIGPESVFESPPWRSLQAEASRMNPPMPRSAADLAAQGFVIVDPRDLPPEEGVEAKQFWSGYGVRSWYRNHKPWATLVGELARAAGAASVLEFGCNMGRNLLAVREALPDARLVGIDVNPDAVRAGMEKSTEMNAGLDLRLGDEQTLRGFAEGEFDLVFTVSVLDHIADVSGVCWELIRCARRHVFCLEVTLPVEGKVLRHYDHHHGEIRPSTGASYSWDLRPHFENKPRVERLDCRPAYLHSANLGPYYWSYLAHLTAPAHGRESP